MKNKIIKLLQSKDDSDNVIGWELAKKHWKFSWLAKWILTRNNIRIADHEKVLVISYWRDISTYPPGEFTGYGIDYDWVTEKVIRKWEFYG